MINEKINTKGLRDRLDIIILFLLLNLFALSLSAVFIHKELHEINTKQYVIKTVYDYD